jgi:hypothetical protein
MKTFHRQLAKQLIVAKSAAFVKKEKHKKKLFANFRCKIIFFFIVFYVNAS